MSLSSRSPVRLFALLVGLSLLASTVAVALPPLPARGQEAATELSVGRNSSCQITDGVIYCWGLDSGGVLGNGPELNEAQAAPGPVDMSGLPPGTVWRTVSVEQDDACALTTTGDAYCWGSAAGPSPTPVDISGLPDGTTWSMISTGRDHKCGVTTAGDAYCWGSGSVGRLGTGSTANQSTPAPVDISGLPDGTTWSTIGTGSFYSCGVTTAGDAYCWGQNSFGQLGRNGTGNFLSPLPLDTSDLPVGIVWDSISVGPNHACALTPTADAYCWGPITGADGGTEILWTPSPVDMSGLPAGTAWDMISAGSAHTCGLTTSGDAHCWSSDATGALGNGPDQASSAAPSPVDLRALPIGAEWTALSAGRGGGTCGATDQGTTYCWGSNSVGQLGIGVPGNRQLPTQVLPIAAPTVGEAPTIEIGPDSVLQAGLGDPTNPTVAVTVADAESPAGNLQLTVESSSNPAVLPVGNVAISGSDEERTLSVTPVARGIADLLISVTDDDGNSTFSAVGYAVSDTIPDSSGRYHAHISDASAALDVGDSHMLLVNDETNEIFLHQQDTSGLPVKTWDTIIQELGTNEIDFESIARSGDLLVMAGSHGNNREGNDRRNRRIIVGATVTGTGADTELSYLGHYGDDGLWADLRNWDATNGHGLGVNFLGIVAGSEEDVLPNPPDGFNMEAMEFAPDGETLYLGFRAPTVDVDGNEHALIVPVTNVDDLVAGSPGTGPGTFGDPILLDLDGRSIRAMRANEHGEYLISAGPSPSNETWALYTWDGDPASAPQFDQELPEPDYLVGGAWESIVAVPHPLEGGTVRLVADSGDTNFYGTGQTKDLVRPLQKSYSQEFVLAGGGGSEAGEQSINVTVPDVVEPGEFVWSIDGDPNVQMTEAVNAGSYLHSTGELTPIVVTDTREGGPVWSLSGQVSDFNGGLSGSYLGWTPEVITAGAGATAGDPVASGFDSGNGLTDASTLAFADAGHELGTGSVGADLDLRIPVDTPAGEESALTLRGICQCLIEILSVG